MLMHSWCDIMTDHFYKCDECEARFKSSMRDPSLCSACLLADYGLIRHRFMLRPDFAVEMELPHDLTLEEAGRLSGAVVTLPFKGPATYSPSNFNLRSFIEKTGMSVNGFAGAVDVHQSTLRKKLAGKSKITEQFMLKIDRCFDLATGKAKRAQRCGRF